MFDSSEKFDSQLIGNMNILKIIIKFGKQVSFTWFVIFQGMWNVT